MSSEVIIEFDNAHGVFMPGSEVTGTVVLALGEPVKANSVLISVHGEARTHWTMPEPRTRSVVRTDPQGNTRHETETYYEQVPYTGSCPYASGSAIVWTPPGGAHVDHIPAGNHRFPFRFLLPNNCPASFEGTFGYIRYYCKGRIDRPWYKMDKASKRVFTVIATSDLNYIPNVARPLQVGESKQTGVLFFKSGRINLTLNVHKGGFVPGETIALVADIVNASSQKIKTIKIKIVQCSHYVAYRGSQVLAPGTTGFGASSVGGLRALKEDHREVFRSEEKVEIVKGAAEKLTRLVPIPAVVSTFNNCPIITVEYFIKMKLTTNGAISTNLNAQLPIVIGTVPLMQAAPAPMPAPAYPQMPQPGGVPPPPLYPQISSPGAPPPSYADCVFGAGKVKDEDENAEFTPRYPIYPNIAPSAPPMEK